MNRAKIRKAVAALPKFLPPSVLKQALKNVTNDRARAQIEKRYRQRDAAK